MMNVEQIRALANRRNPSPDYRRVTAECDHAIKMGPLSPAAHSELLYYYAEAMARLDPARAPMCIQYAQRAAKLANEASKNLIFVRATCLHLRLRAQIGEDLRLLQGQFSRLKKNIESGKLPLTAEERAQTAKFIAGTETVINLRRS